MNEIKCPHCTKSFNLDEAGYADIQKQVRDREFESELKKREADLENLRQNEIQLTEAKASAKLVEAMNAKELEFSAQRAKTDKDFSDLRNQVANFELQKRLDLKEATSALELERSKLESDLDNERTQKDFEIQALKSAHLEMLRVELDHKNSEIRYKDEAIERLKDFKAKLSTKMVGEDLEQHCENEFNKIRATAFQGKDIQFEKDNDVSSGSKGDYIFREFDEEKVELISIMFEMKNEMDATVSKKKNEDFFKQLDVNRTKKGCEFAVLVSNLENESDLYNSGIVDVSYRYPKMYVVRPQLFITIITLLRNAALGSMQYKAALVRERSQNLDISNFENRLNEFKQGFDRNFGLASKQLLDAIAGIDKTIKEMQKVRDGLVSSQNNLRLANEKAGDITVKKLTKGNPTMTEMFEQKGSSDAV